MVNNFYPQANLPQKYRNLPNFLAGAYDVATLRLAVALSDVWQIDGLGGGGGSGSVSVTSLPSIPAGTNFIGRTGIRGFRATGNFTRPNDTNAYAVNDAITTSTSAPLAPMSADLASFGAANGSFICITNARIITGTAQSTLLTANIFVFNQAFTSTNDNTQLSIDDTTAQTGGIVIPCLNTYNLSANARCVSDPGQWIMQLGASSTTIHFALQATNAYTPASSERFDVILEGYLL